MCRKFSCTSCRFFVQNYEIHHNFCTCRKIFHMGRNIPAQPLRLIKCIHVQEISCMCRKKQQNVQSLLMLKSNVSYLNENMFTVRLSFAQVVSSSYRYINFISLLPEAISYCLPTCYVYGVLVTLPCTYTPTFMATTANIR